VITSVNDILLISRSKSLCAINMQSIRGPCDKHCSAAVYIADGCYKRWSLSVHSYNTATREVRANDSTNFRIFFRSQVVGCEDPSEKN